jgi:hypothetical protein
MPIQIDFSLVSGQPQQGFHLILRLEDCAIGAPDPACWIEPLMK